MKPNPSTDAAASVRVLDRGDYKLFAGSFALLVVLVATLVLLISTFKQVMAVRWLSRPEQRSRVEVRQYVAILAEEKGVEAIDRLRTRPDGMPSLFAAMALAGKGDAGMARLRPDVESGSGEQAIAAMAATEYERPGSLLPFLRSASDPVRWAAAVQAATLADIYSTVDFIRVMDGLFIALFPGRKAISAETMGDYQRGLIGLRLDPDRPDPLTDALAFHDGQLRQHPELYKPGVKKEIQDSWEAYLKRVFQQRVALHANQEAVRGAVAGATNLPPSALEAANRFLAGRYPGNPLTLKPAGDGEGRAQMPVSTGVGAGQTLLRRDGGALRAFAASADGRTLVSGGFDNLARVWTSGKEAEPLTLAGHAFGVLAAAVAPDGTRVATAGLDGTIRLWDAATGRPAATQDAGTRRVAALAFSPDGATLAAGGAAGTIRLLDAATGAERRVLRWHAAEVTALAFTADGKRLVAGNLDRSLSLWKLDDAEARPVVLEKHTDAVWCLAASPDGRWLASGGADRRVMMWTIQDKKPKARLLKAHKGVVTALAASADGRWLASAGADRLLVVWDAARGRVFSAHPTDVIVNGLQFEPDGQALRLVCEDGTVRRWKVSGQDERPFSFADFALWLMKKD
jgi:dipeptidyl aminopeptidase/acylaminoacyl peptidase